MTAAVQTVETLSSSVLSPLAARSGSLDDTTASISVLQASAQLSEEPEMAGEANCLDDHHHHYVCVGRTHAAERWVSLSLDANVFARTLRFSPL